MSAHGSPSVGDMAACPLAQHIQLSERMFAVFSAASS